MANHPNPFHDEEVILGVDTHNDVHVAAVITPLGILLGSKPFPATPAGYASLLTWAHGHDHLHRRAPAPTARP